MMNKLLALILAIGFLTPGVQAQDKFESPDILVDTKLNSDWSGILVTRIRKLLRNYKYADPFRQKFEKPMMIYESEVGKFLNPSSRDLLVNLGEMLEMDFLGAKTQIMIHGLQYSVRGFKSDLSITDEKEDSVTIAANSSASHVKVSADKVVLTLTIPGKRPLPVITIEVVNPIILANDSSLVNFFSRIKLRSQQENYVLKLEHLNFDNMAQGLVSSNGIEFRLGHVVVPKVSIKVGNKTINFDQDKIEALILSKQGDIKDLILAQLSTVLEKGFGNSKEKSLKASDELSFKKEHWIDAISIFSFLKFNSFTSSATNGHVIAKMDGEFCSPYGWKTYGKDCVAHRFTHSPKSRLTLKDHERSVDYMRELVDKKNANIVVSISEDYVNKILATTIDAGHWDKILDTAGVKMGSNKPFIRLDEAGSKTGTLYLDMVYTAKKLERMALGSKEVRFPLTMKVGIKIKSDKSSPVFVIHITELDTSDDMLINGKPELGVVSNIHKLRFKKKVLDAIREETKAVANSEVLQLKYSPLRGLELEKVDFISDGLGRMNALILLKEPKDEDEAI